MSNVLARLQGVSDMEFYRVALDLNTELSAFLMSEKNVPKKWRAIYTYPILALMESLFDYIEDANAIWPNSDELVAERKRLQKECINCVTKIYGKLQRAMRVVWWQNDDSYLLAETLEDARRLLSLLFVEYDRLGIIPNRKKTQIVKLSRGFSFLKTRYYLTESGKVIRKPDHKAIVRTRRRVKKHRRMVEDGIMTAEQATQSYMSARGALLTRDAYRSVHGLDQLFYSLYGTTPWKKIKRRKYQNGK